MPQVSGHFPRKDKSPFNNWRRKVEPSQDASRPQAQETIDQVAAANQFVGKQENRKQLLGTLTSNDLPRKLCKIRL